MQLFAAILYGRNERGEIDSVNGRQRIRFLHAISLEYNLTKTISEPTFWGVVSADCSMSQYSHQQQKHEMLAKHTMVLPNNAHPCPQRPLGGSCDDIV